MDSFLALYTQHELDGQQYFQRMIEKNDASLLGAASIHYVTYPPNVTLNRRYPIRFHRHERYCQRNYHMHTFLEIMCMYRGKAIHLVNGETMILQTGELCLLPPGVSHAVEIYDDSILVNLLIEISELHHLLPLLQDYDSILSRFLRTICMDIKEDCPQYLRITPGSDPYLTAHLHRMLTTYYSDDKMTDVAMFSGTLSLFVHLMFYHDAHTRFATPIPPHMTVLLPILEYMNIYYRTITLSSLAKHFSYTEQHICHLFRIHLGKTFNEYLTELRLGLARLLLLATDLSFHEIAIHCGYSGSSYFHRMFKEKVGMTPNEYRRTEQCTHNFPHMV